MRKHPHEFPQWSQPAEASRMRDVRGSTSVSLDTSPNAGITSTISESVNTSSVSANMTGLCPVRAPGLNAKHANLQIGHCPLDVNTSVLHKILLDHCSTS